MRRFDNLAAAAGAVFVLGGLGAAGSAAASDASAAKATTTIESKSGSKVTGKAVFTELASGGVKVEVWIENATPGTHGIHLHEKGDCSAPDATSAGPHFNPSGNPHAGPADSKHHNGDWGNITVGADGKGHLEITSDMLTTPHNSLSSFSTGNAKNSFANITSCTESSESSGETAGTSVITSSTRTAESTCSGPE